MTKDYYEIRVRGTLPPEAMDGFGYLKVSPQPVQTVVRGSLCCQKALLRLLSRLECFGAPVIEVHRVPDKLSPAWGNDQENLG